MMLMTQAAWAKSQGFSRQYVQKLIKNGRIKLVDGKIEAESANHTLITSRDYDRPERRKGTAETEALHQMLLKSKVKTEIAKSKIFENKAKQGEDEWMLVSEVRAVAFQRGREIRDALLNIPDRIADQLAVITDAHEIYMLLSDEIRNAVEALTRDV